MVESGHMTGHAPAAGIFTRVAATFAAAKEVKPVANCPYANVSTAEGMGLIVEELGTTIPPQAKVTGSKAIATLIADHFELKAPFVRHSIWIDDFEADKGGSPSGRPARASTISTS